MAQRSLAAMRLAIISDTHLPRGTRRLPAACLEELRAAEAILHAGDFIAEAVLDELLALGPPVHAVTGNCDGPGLRRRLGDTLCIDLGGVQVGMVHDAGHAHRRLERMRTAFPDCAAVVFGHSHIPLHERSSDGFQIFNPGSPTDRRRQPRHTMGIATVAGGEIAFELRNLD
jgi:putative phosphoesterase